MDREKLLRMVQTYGFAAHEWNLYLDTHPRDKKAIAMFHKMSKIAMDYQNQYEEKYGPLTVFSSSNTEVWDWIEQPWPWEM